VTNAQVRQQKLNAAPIDVPLENVSKAINCVMASQTVVMEVTKRRKIAIK
jgi:hypothetical protein